MRKIALIGGDDRLLFAADRFRQAGFRPFVYGNEGAAAMGLCAPYTLRETLEGAEAVVLGIPTEKKKGFVFAPRFEKEIPCAALAGLVPPQATVFLWGQPKDGTFANLMTYNLEQDAVLVAQNARATAEAAMLLALKESGKALFCTKSAILGFGRIGSRLADNLLALGGEVRVGARREESRKSAALLGCAAFLPNDEALFSGVDVIFNTVPAPILSAQTLAKLDKNVIFIELASPPGALDGRKVPCRVVNGASLPGRFCHQSAGAFVAQAVLDQLMKEGGGAPW